MVETDAFYPPDAVGHSAEEQRAFYARLFAHFSYPRPPGLRTSDATVAGPAGPIPIRIYRPDIAGPIPVLLYLHGGGFIVGDLDSHDCVCAELAEAAGIAVAAVAYRLAPEHPFPAAFDDCCAVLSALDQLALEHDFDASRLVVAGDSAGGNLTAATCMRARDVASPAVKGQILIYPGLGGDMTRGSYI